MRYLIAAVVAVILALPVAAEEFQKGLQAYERGDYGTAFRQWRPLAEQGDAIAQNNLGFMYAQGEGSADEIIEARGLRQLSDTGALEAMAVALRQGDRNSDP